MEAAHEWYVSAEYAEALGLEYANAFLLGVDIRFIATDEEVEILNAFFGVQSVSDEEL